MGLYDRPVNIKAGPGALRRLAATTALIELLAGHVDRPLQWEEFLPVFECWCMAHGWDVEYGLIEDESCAIFPSVRQMESESEERPGPLPAALLRDK